MKAGTMTLTMKSPKRFRKGRVIQRLVLFVLMSILLFGCNQEDKKHEEILVGAAASLKPVMEELQIMYKEDRPEVTVTFTFASSGSLEQQIREGAPIDVFFSAGLKQMDALIKDNFILTNTKVELLENEIVLIVPKDSNLEISSFEDLQKVPVIALGDPESVPVGQYAKEILEGLGTWDEISKSATFGKDVTEVLTWVSSGNADAGVVYATDAALTSEVEVVARAPEGSHSKAIYPAAVVKESKEEAAAEDFIQFLATEKAKEVFIRYGFKVID